MGKPREPRKNPNPPVPGQPKNPPPRTPSRYPSPFPPKPHEIPRERTRPSEPPVTDQPPY